MDVLHCQALQTQTLDYARQLLSKLMDESSYEFTAREHLDLREAFQTFKTPMQGFNEALLNSFIHHLYCVLEGMASASIMTEKDVEVLDQQNWCCYSDDDFFRSSSFEILSTVKILAATRSDRREVDSASNVHLQMDSEQS
jgi:hypothetical protein